MVNKQQYTSSHCDIKHLSELCILLSAVYFMLYIAVTVPQPSSPKEEQNAEKRPGTVIHQESVDFNVCRGGVHTQY